MIGTVDNNEIAKELTDNQIVLIVRMYRLYLFSDETIFLLQDLRDCFDNFLNSESEMSADLQYLSNNQLVQIFRKKVKLLTNGQSVFLGLTRSGKEIGKILIENSDEYLPEEIIDLKIEE